MPNLCRWMKFCLGSKNGLDPAPTRRRVILMPLLLAASVTVSGCQPETPVQLAFLGSFSGKGADLGESGRNGALLAIEDANANGGIAGRDVELLVYDDQQDPNTALRALETIAKQDIKLIIGPMTSSVAEAIYPALQRLELFAISPTVTASALHGQADRFFTIASPTQRNSQVSANKLYQQGARRVAIIYDTNNRAFSQDWADHYRQYFTAVGGKVVALLAYDGSQSGSFGHLIEQAKRAEADSLMLVSGAVDTVRLVQLARKEGDPTWHIVASSWAATEHLIQLGGRSVEGVWMTQFFNREHQAARYRDFSVRYQQRFRQDPGFASVTAYDATQAIIQALRQKSPQQTLDHALLHTGPYTGLQAEWTFDRHGDANRPTFLTIVKNGRFELFP